jgi:uncharacterized HAD superfamily protein
MLSTVLRRIKNNGVLDDEYGLFGDGMTLTDLPEIQNTFVPNEIDDAEEQVVNIIQENRLDRGLIHTEPNTETLDLKDYLDMVDFKENLKADNLENDLDEVHENDLAAEQSRSKHLTQTSLESYAKNSVHNDINFNFENFYKH